MAQVLILYSTTDGQTRRICERLQAVIDGQGHAVTLLSLNENENADTAPFDAVIVGASVRYGKHQPAVRRFIEKNAASLTNKASALFSVNLVARDPIKCTPEGNPYLQKLLKQMAWHPPILEVFAGKLDYPLYTLWDRVMIKLIMKITHGPTNIDTIEYTDWNQVEVFGNRMAQAAIEASR